MMGSLEGLVAEGVRPLEARDDGIPRQMDRGPLKPSTGDPDSTVSETWVF